MVQLRKRGLFTIVICSAPFESLATNQARILGVPDLPLVFVDHPFAGIDLPEVRERARQAGDQILRLLAARKVLS